MGKKQHSKDRMFITATEWKYEYGGHKEEKKSSDRQLPFDCCALSLAPFETPVCTKEGVIFDILQIMPYVKQHRKNPLNGEPLAPKQLIRLNMQKNAEGKWHCPVTFKVFNNFTHVVAIKPTGNVFSFEAINELNLKTKSFIDLLTGEPFSKSDILTLQNPSDPEVVAKRNLDNFIHLKELREEQLAKIASASHESNIRQDAMSQSVLLALDSKRKADSEAKAAAEKEERKVPKKPKITTEDLEEGWKMTSGKVSGSFTSSRQTVHTQNDVRDATEEEIREARWKRIRKLGKKGYVQMQTSVGNLNLEIACDMVPRTSENFLGLCEKGYYDGTTFHRVMRNFMAQGGDPTGTGRGGESLWGEPFKDEFESRLVHHERGVLAMANSGPNTNKSQFYITFKSCRHLDNQHSVFGKVVGGMEALRKLELVETDKKDKPKQEVKIVKAVVFVNPIEEAVKLFEDELEEKRRNREKQAMTQKEQRKALLNDDEDDRIGWYSRPTPEHKMLTDAKTGIGKYMGSTAETTLPAKLKDDPEQIEKCALVDLHQFTKPAPSIKSNKTLTKTVFKDFSSW